MSSLKKLQPTIGKYIQFKLGKRGESGKSPYDLAVRALALDGRVSPTGVGRNAWLLENAEFMRAALWSKEAKGVLRAHRSLRTERREAVNPGAPPVPPAPIAAPAWPEPKPPATRKCKFCGEPITFSVGRTGRPVPINPDGRDHLETCALMTKEYKRARLDKNHEARVAGHFKAPKAAPKRPEPQPAAPGYFKLTEAYLDAFTNCGVPTAVQAKIIGVSYPLRSGWRTPVIGRVISIAERIAFEGALTNRGKKKLKERGSLGSRSKSRVKSA